MVASDREDRDSEALIPAFISFQQHSNFFRLKIRCRRNAVRPSELSHCGDNEEAHMPAIFIPVLWVGGAAILLGGGWYVIGHVVH